MRSELGWPDDARAEALWRWKHEQNPFGASPVWVAEHEEQVVAVRAFLRWEMITADRTVIRVARAVDTATRVDHRGRGLFRMLTLHGLEALDDLGVQFVFNTPNSQSRPGYLSMGWVDVERLPVWVRPLHVSSLPRMLRARTAAGLWPAGSEAGIPVAALAVPGAGRDHSGSVQSLLHAGSSWVPQAGAVGTARSEAYFRWRFGLPELGYRLVLGDTNDSGVILRDRLRGSVVERSVLEVLGGTSAPQLAARMPGRANHLVAIGRRPGRGWFRLPATGPHLVVRALAGATRPDSFELTLGDVELL